VLEIGRMSGDVVKLSDWCDFNSAAPQRQDDDRQSEMSVDDLKARLLGNLTTCSIVNH